MGFERTYIQPPVKWSPDGDCPICQIPFKYCQHQDDPEYVNQVVKNANEERAKADIKHSIMKQFPLPKV